MPELARLDGLRSELERDARFAAAVLFGSAVRGRLRSDSDVDVAVLYVNDEGREQAERDLTTVLGKVAMACGRNVHLIDLDRVSSDLGRAIFAESKTLLDRSQTRLRAVHARILRDYFDWAYARSVIDAAHDRRLRAAVVADSDILRRKTQQVLHHVSRLRARAGLTQKALAANEDLRNALLMDLQQAIQGCIDLAVHACADESLGAPTSPAEAFALLANSGRIERELATRLAGTAALRNLIVYRYTELDTERLLAAVRGDLSDLETFVAAFRT